jgi:hypothetical protein
MSQVIRIPSDIYKRLEAYAVGFDTPAGVIERLLNFYESHAKGDYKPMEAHVSNKVHDASFFQSRPISSTPKTGTRIYSTSARGRFTRNLEDETYTITSPEGESKTFKLPSANDKEGIRMLTHQVEEFVEKQGGTIGQIKAARKKLTEFGYHITK